MPSSTWLHAGPRRSGACTSGAGARLRRTPSRGRSSAARSRRSIGSGTASVRKASMAGVPESSAAKRSTNSAHGSRPVGRPRPSSWQRPAGDLLLRHQRPDLGRDVDRLARGDQRVDLRGAEEARQRRAPCAQLEVGLGVDRRRAGSRDQVGLSAGGQVAQAIPVGRAAAMALVEQHDEASTNARPSPRTSTVSRGASTEKSASVAPRGEGSAGPPPPHGRRGRARPGCGVASRCPASTTASPRSGGPSSRCTTWVAPSSVSPIARAGAGAPCTPAGRRPSTSSRTQPR